MTKQSLTILTAVGLLFALASSALVFATLDPQHNNIPASLGYLLLGMIAAAIAGRALLGRGVTTRFGRLLVPLLSAISFAVISSAATTALISSHVFDSLSHVGETLGSSFVVAIVIGFVVYLAAATFYGFAGTAQGVPVGARTALLVLLLLAVIPGLNILGLAGLLVTVLVREPRGSVEMNVAEAPAPETPAL